jgi:hypothetical protein
MGKRANNQTAAVSAKTTAKKSKMDPVLSTICDVILEADHLPEGCRTMLVDMLPFSLGLPEDTRHELQTMAVDMIEQTLRDKKCALEKVIAAEESKMEQLKSSEVELVSEVTGAEAALSAQKIAVDKAKATLAAATESARTGAFTLDALRAAKTAADAKLAATRDEKQALESAFEMHFKAPMENQQGPNFPELEKWLQKIEVEASLITALPSTCVKTKEERGSFDLLCLQELERAITSKIASLSNSVAVETPAALERETAEKLAAKEEAAMAEAQTQAAAELEATLKEQSERETSLSAAKSAVDAFHPRVEEMMASVSKAKATLEDFQTGPIAGFQSHKERREATAEAALAAGA